MVYTEFVFCLLLSCVRACVTVWWWWWCVCERWEGGGGSAVRCSPCPDLTPIISPKRSDNHTRFSLGFVAEPVGFHGLSPGFCLGLYRYAVFFFFGRTHNTMPVLGFGTVPRTAAVHRFQSLDSDHLPHRQRKKMHVKEIIK